MHRLQVTLLALAKNSHSICWVMWMMSSLYLQKFKFTDLQPLPCIFGEPLQQREQMSWRSPRRQPCVRTGRSGSCPAGAVGVSRSGTTGSSSLKHAGYTLMTSDNFSFQNNGIKKFTCWKTMGYFGKQWVFKKSNVFLHDFTHDLFWL